MTRYQIDAATYQAAYNSAAAGLAQAQAAYTAAKLKADRFGTLVATGAVSRQDNDDAQAASQQAAANVAAQKASVDAARINLGYTRVTAPISGRIGKSSVTPGALVTASQTAALATPREGRADPLGAARGRAERTDDRRVEQGAGQRQRADQQRRLDHPSALALCQPLALGAMSEHPHNQASMALRSEDGKSPAAAIA